MLDVKSIPKATRWNGTQGKGGFSFAHGGGWCVEGVFCQTQGDTNHTSLGALLSRLFSVGWCFTPSSNAQGACWSFPSGLFFCNSLVRLLWSGQEGITEIVKEVTVIVRTNFSRETL